MIRILLLFACFAGSLTCFSQPPTIVEQTAKQLEADVRTLASEIGERNPVHYENLQRAREWVFRSLSTSIGAPQQQTYMVGGMEVANIIAVKKGELPELGSIVIGAHYDSAPGTPGADDNASAVAVMLELARLFSHEKTRHTLDFAAFTLEEPPYFRSENMGSMKLAKEWRDSGKQIELMICLEMLGCFTDDKIQEFPLPGMGFVYPEQGNFIAAIGELGSPEPVTRFSKLLKANSTLPAVSFSGPRIMAGIDFSDHQSFWCHQYPAVMVTDTAFYRNKRYHSSSDTPETLNYPAMARVVESLYKTIKAFDDAP